MSAPEKSLEDEKIIHQHTPKVFALRSPTFESCELIITTVAKTSHIFHLTYDQICLLASESERARISWPKSAKTKKT